VWLAPSESTPFLPTSESAPTAEGLIDPFDTSLLDLDLPAGRSLGKLFLDALSWGG
jgi:hypothetical protein